MSLARTYNLTPEQFESLCIGEPVAWDNPPLDADRIMLHAPFRAEHPHCRWCLGHLEPEVAASADPAGRMCPWCGRSDGETLTCAQVETIAQRIAGVLLQGDVCPLDWLGAIVTEYEKLMKDRREPDEDPEATQMAISESKAALVGIRAILAEERGLTATNKAMLPASDGTPNDFTPEEYRQMGGER